MDLNKFVCHYVKRTLSTERLTVRRLDAAEVIRREEHESRVRYPPVRMVATQVESDGPYSSVIG